MLASLYHNTLKKKKKSGYQKQSRRVGMTVIKDTGAEGL